MGALMALGVGTKKENLGGGTMIFMKLLSFGPFWRILDDLRFTFFGTGVKSGFQFSDLTPESWKPIGHTRSNSPHLG